MNIKNIFKIYLKRIFALQTIEIRIRSTFQNCYHYTVRFLYIQFSRLFLLIEIIWQRWHTILLIRSMGNTFTPKIDSIPLLFSPHFCNFLMKQTEKMGKFMSSITAERTNLWFFFCGHVLRVAVSPNLCPSTLNSNCFWFYV